MSDFSDEDLNKSIEANNLPFVRAVKHLLSTSNDIGEIKHILQPMLKWSEIVEMICTLDKLKENFSSLYPEFEYEFLEIPDQKFVLLTSELKNKFEYLVNEAKQKSSLLPQPQEQSDEQSDEQSSGNSSGIEGSGSPEGTGI